jgi:integrase/recombinase XerD
MRKQTSSISLTTLIQGYVLHAEASRYAPATITQYTKIFTSLADCTKAATLAEIDVEDIEAFLSLQDGVSDATLCKYHTALSSLFTWAVKQKFVDENIMRYVERARPEKRAIQPFTEHDARAMLAACDRTRVYTRPGKAPCNNARPTAARDRAIILLLLDTGLRANELCTLRIQDVNLKKRELIVFGKGDKERVLPFDASTGQALWLYLTSREAADPRVDEPLFVSSNTPLDRFQLRRLLVRIGDRAGVSGVHPHRFRHTFAINYLRNQGDIYTLQAMLGHTSLDMVRRYLAIAQTDVKAAHRRASPVANWKL